MDVQTLQGRPHPCSEEEWQVRCDLAALYRLVAHLRMTDFIFTHITARVPGAGAPLPDQQLRRAFHEMRASDLVKIDLDGNVVEDGPAAKEVNTAGFTIHSAVHRRGRTWPASCTPTPRRHRRLGAEAGLLPISQHALKYHGRLAYHGYEGVALDLDERERLVADLGPHDAMILRNHGLLAAGGPSRMRSTRSTSWSGPARRRSPRWPAAPSWCSRRRRCGSAPPRIPPRRRGALGAGLEGGAAVGGPRPRRPPILSRARLRRGRSAAAPWAERIGGRTRGMPIYELDGQAPDEP